MSFVSFLFWAVLIVPFVVFLGFLLRQDKRKGMTGLIVLAVIVVVGIVYMYLTTKGK